MAEYIDRDKLIEGRVINDPVRIAAMCEPVADVEPVKHGAWRAVGGCMQLCSECDFFTTPPVQYNYCPNCGAKMDGGVNNE